MKFTNEVKVRFGETDALGHVNNSSFFVYIENARIDFLMSIGACTSMKDWSYVVGHVSCDFIKQVFFNEELIISSYVSNIGTKSFTLLHDVVRKSNGEIVAKGKAVLIQFNFDLQRSEPIPEAIRTKLQDYRETVSVSVNGGEVV